jgi:hypothetical protein
MKRLACLCLLLLTSTGCANMMHELQPHRLWRMNYQEPAGRTDGVYFSIDDSLDVPVAREHESPAMPAHDKQG